MKRSQILIILLCAISLVSACDKFKYREQYTGNFAFNTIRKVVGTLDSTNTNFAGYVELYDKDALLIRFLESDSLSAKIAEDGTLSVPSFVVNGGTFEGSFSDPDHLSFDSKFVSFTSDTVVYKVIGVRN